MQKGKTILNFPFLPSTPSLFSLPLLPPSLSLSSLSSPPSPPRISSDVIAGIVTKCLNGRPKTKEGSIHICLMFVEIEQQEVVLEEILKGFTNKQPKIIAGSAQVIIRILQ